MILNDRFRPECMDARIGAGIMDDANNIVFLPNDRFRPTLARGYYGQIGKWRSHSLDLF